RWRGAGTARVNATGRRGEGARRPSLVRSCRDTPPQACCIRPCACRRARRWPGCAPSSSGGVRTPPCAGGSGPPRRRSGPAPRLPPCPSLGDLRLSAVRGGQRLQGVAQPVVYGLRVVERHLALHLLLYVLLVPFVAL